MNELLHTIEEVNMFCQLHFKPFEPDWADEEQLKWYIVQNPD